MLPGAAVTVHDAPQPAAGTAGAPAHGLRLGDRALATRPLVVASLGLAEIAALDTARNADAIELRADLAPAPTPHDVVEALGRLRATGRPVLLTVRGVGEGGGLEDDGLRLAIYRTAAAHADGIDLEIASVPSAGDIVRSARAAGRLVLLSFHDFTGTPSTAFLLERIAEAAARGADVAKIATLADTSAALRTLIEATLTSAHPVTVLGMGRLGPLSRLVLPAAGSLLTYGAAGTPTAPGQIPVGELVALRDRLWPS